MNHSLKFYAIHIVYSTGVISKFFLENVENYPTPNTNPLQLSKGFFTNCEPAAGAEEHKHKQIWQAG